jgi:hypothetical protein
LLRITQECGLFTVSSSFIDQPQSKLIEYEGHIAWHAEAGMLMQFLTRPDVVAGWTTPDNVKGLCAQRENQRGGGIPDEDFWEMAKKPTSGAE